MEEGAITAPLIACREINNRLSGIRISRTSGVTCRIRRALIADQLCPQASESSRQEIPELVSRQFALLRLRCCRSCIRVFDEEREDVFPPLVSRFLPTTINESSRVIPPESLPLLAFHSPKERISRSIFPNLSGAAHLLLLALETNPSCAVALLARRWRNQTWNRPAVAPHAAEKERTFLTLLARHTQLKPNRSDPKCFGELIRPGPQLEVDRAVSKADKDDLGRRFPQDLGMRALVASRTSIAFLGEVP